MINFILFLVIVLAMWTFTQEKRIRKLERGLPVETPVGASAIEFFKILANGELQKLGEKMFLKVSDKVALSIAIKDKFGNAAAVDGLPAWALTDESLAELQVAEGGMSAMLLPKGPIGVFQVQVKADADVGEGVKEIIGSLDVELAAGEAVSVDISAGVPEAQ